MSARARGAGGAQVRSVCGEYGLAFGYANGEKAAEMKSVSGRVFAAYDANGDGLLSAAELQPTVGTSDGKLSLASLDPGSGSLLDAGYVMGLLWNAFIAGLILFFVYSIVEQVRPPPRTPTADLHPLTSTHCTTL